MLINQYPEEYGIKHDLINFTSPLRLNFCQFGVLGFRDSGFLSRNNAKCRNDYVVDCNVSQILRNIDLIITVQGRQMSWEQAIQTGLRVLYMAVTLKLSVLLALIVVLALGFGHNIWAGFFSDSHEIIQEFASMTPLLTISIIADSVQGVLSANQSSVIDANDFDTAGVARGCGLQHFVVYVNLATFYCIGVPIAALLGFTLKLKAKGLWIGLICGLSCQAATLLLVTLRTTWTKLDLSKHNKNENPVVV
ncbi:protein DETOXIFICATION 18-like [Fagus crenata]